MRENSINPLQLTQAPVDTSDPLFDRGLANARRLFFARDNYRNLDPAAGIVSTLQGLPPPKKVSSF